MKLLHLFEKRVPKVSFPKLFEATKIGREYQHLEDLLIIDGAKGGIDAVNELKHISEQPGTMNMKWDGGAAVFWGRNQEGNFVFVPGNQWSKGQQLDRAGLATEIQHTGRPRPGQSDEEFAAIRKSMAENYLKLWDLFERATPKDFKGYLNGDLMFSEPQQPGPDGYYEFTPNKVTYRVTPNGLYGKMKTAQAFVAVHGKINEFGAPATGNLENVPETVIQQFNKTPELIVLPTQHPEVELNPIDQETESVLSLIKNNAVSIDTIANYTAEGLSGLKKLLYEYSVKRAKSNGKLDFLYWLKNSKASDKQKSLIQKLITDKAHEWEKFWTAFNSILNLKNQVLENLHNVHSKYMSDNLGITAITANKPGGEGFIKRMASGGMAKLVNPHFRSAPDNPRFTPNLNEGVNDEVSSKYINTLFRDLNKNNIDSPNVLFDLSYFTMYKNCPNLEEKLTPYKSKIIKLILVFLKSNKIRYSTISDAINTLKKAGANWPELDIIQRSMDADKKLNENDFDFDRTIDITIRGKIRALRDLINYADAGDGNFRQMNYIISSLGWKSDTTQLPNMSKQLNQYKKEILRAMLEQIQQTGLDYLIVDEIKGLKCMGVSWPELAIIQKSLDVDKITERNDSDTKLRRDIFTDRLFQSIEKNFPANAFIYLANLGSSYSTLPNESERLNKHKIFILRSLLQDIKNYGFSRSIYHVIKALKSFGVDWPELKAIENSNEAERRRRTKKVDIIDEDEEDKSKVQKCVNALHRMLNGFPPSRTDDLNHWFNYLSIICTEDEKRQVLELPDVHKVILEWVVKKFGTKNYRTMYFICRELSRIAFYGVQWPEAPLAIQYKILKPVIEIIKNRQRKMRFEDVTPITNSLKIIGVYINAISKFDAPVRDRNKIILMFKNALDIDDVYQAVSLLRFHNMDVQKYPIIIDTINKFKHDIIRNLLQIIKAEFATDITRDYTETLMTKLNDLRSVGIDWPELNGIRKSVESRLTSITESKQEKVKCWVCNGTGIDYGETCLQCGGIGKTWDDGSYILDDDEEIDFPEVEDDDYHQYIWNDNITEDKEPTYVEDIDDNVGYIKEKLATNDYSDDLMWDCLMHLGEYYEDYPKIKFPNIAQLLNAHKEPLLTKMLSGLKSNKLGIYTLLPMVIALKKLGVTWSELDIIEKSMRHDRNRIKQNGLNEDWNRVTQLNAKRKVDNILMLLNDYDSDKLWSELYKLGIYYMSSYINPIDISAALNKHKKGLLSKILQTIAETGELRHIEAWVTALKKSGANWPELDTIEKSIKHDKTRNGPIDEAEFPLEKYYQENHYRTVGEAVAYDIYYIKWFLKNKNYDDPKPWENLKFLSNIYVLGANAKLPNEAELFNMHKNKMLEYMLQYIKDCGINRRYSFYNVKHWILALRKMGVAWPELDIIEKSVKHDIVGRNAIDESTESNGVVWGFGRTNPPHHGHFGLIDTLENEAKKHGYDWKLFVSSKQEPEKNPLSYEQKIHWLLKLYPKLNGHLVIDSTIKTPLVAATYLYNQGYRSSIFVAGEDDMPSYSVMINNGNNHGKTHQELLSQGKAFLFEPSEFVVSPRLTSATSVRQTVTNNDPVAFAKAVLGPRYSKVDPKTIHDIETSMFSQVKQGMVKPEKLAKKAK